MKRLEANHIVCFILHAVITDFFPPYQFSLLNGIRRISS